MSKNSDGPTQVHFPDELDRALRTRHRIEPFPFRPSPPRPGAKQLLVQRHGRAANRGILAQTKIKLDLQEIQISRVHDAAVKDGDGDGRARELVSAEVINGRTGFYKRSGTEEL